MEFETDAAAEDTDKEYVLSAVSTTLNLSVTITLKDNNTCTVAVDGDRFTSTINFGTKYASSDKEVTIKQNGLPISNFSIVETGLKCKVTGTLSNVPYATLVSEYGKYIEAIEKIAGVVEEVNFANTTELIFVKQAA